MGKNDYNLPKEYERLAPLYARVCEEAVFALEKALRGIKVHDIQSRVKALESLTAKLRRKEATLSDIIDIAGIRVICLLPSELSTVESIVDDLFDVEARDDKVAQSVDTFGYMSVHLTCKLGKSYRGARYDDIRELAFELQLRTLTMHAWASLSHYLDYKSEEATPQHLRKSLNALSALFFVADQQFEAFYRDSQQARKEAKGLSIKRRADLKRQIDFESLKEYLSQRFPDRESDDAAAISELAEELRSNGVTTLAGLTDILDEQADNFLDYEQRYPPQDEMSLEEGRFSAVGAVRVPVNVHLGLDTWRGGRRKR